MVKKWLLWMLLKVTGVEWVYVDDVVTANTPAQEEEVTE